MKNRFTIPAEVSFQKVGKEVFILHRNDSNVFNLNSTAAFIWSEIENGKDVQEIATSVYNRFTTTKEAAYNDTMELIEQLTSNKLITPDYSDEHQ